MPKGQAALVVTADESGRKGILKMLQQNEIRNRAEMAEMQAISTAAAKDALDIEEVVRRAREIHRQHGGIFGYHFEDWALAWSALTEKSSRRTELAYEIHELVVSDSGKASEPCVGCSE